MFEYILVFIISRMSRMVHISSSITAAFSLLTDTRELLFAQQRTELQLFGRGVRDKLDALGDVA